MISVVIPTYNEENNIEKCLLALENQTIARDRYEIIVVDGQSTDQTVKIAKKYSDKVIMQKTRWIAGARNDGVAVAKGDIIAMTDADCVVSKDWLEEITNALMKDNAVAVFGPVILPQDTCFRDSMIFFISNKN